MSDSDNNFLSSFKKSQRFKTFQGEKSTFHLKDKPEEEAVHLRGTNRRISLYESRIKRNMYVSLNNETVNV